LKSPEPRKPAGEDKGGDTEPSPTKETFGGNKTVNIKNTRRYVEETGGKESGPKDEASL